MENTIINEANDALKQLSRDPDAQRLARWREDQLRLSRVELRTAERKGRHNEAREALLDLCEALDLEMTAEHREQIMVMSYEELVDLRRELKRSRQWPE